MQYPEAALVLGKVVRCQSCGSATVAVLVSTVPQAQ